jgi:hypothetical protein
VLYQNATGPGEILTFGTRPERTGPESAAEFVLPCSRLDVGIGPMRRLYMQREMRQGSPTFGLRGA